jgi:hypothetical protein
MLKLKLWKFCTEPGIPNQSGEIFLTNFLFIAIFDNLKSVIAKLKGNGEFGRLLGNSKDYGKIKKRKNQ